MAAPGLHLEVLEGPNAGAHLVWDGAECLIGSSYDCDVVLNDSTLEAYHLKLEISDKGELKILSDPAAIEWLETADPNATIGGLPSKIRLGSTLLQLGQTTTEDELPVSDEEDQSEQGPNTWLSNENLAEVKTVVTRLGRQVALQPAQIYNLAVGMFAAALILALIAIAINFMGPSKPVLEVQPAPISEIPERPDDAARQQSLEGASQTLRRLTETSGFDMVNSGIIQGQLEVWGVVPDSKWSDWLNLVDQYERQHGLAHPISSDVSLASESKFISDIALISLAKNPTLRTKSGRTLRAGDQMADGWLIEKISADGIALSKGPRKLSLGLK